MFILHFTTFLQMQSLTFRTFVYPIIFGCCSMYWHFLWWWISRRILTTFSYQHENLLFQCLNYFNYDSGNIYTYIHTILTDYWMKYAPEEGQGTNWSKLWDRNNKNNIQNTSKKCFNLGIQTIFVNNFPKGMFFVIKII